MTCGAAAHGYRPAFPDSSRANLSGSRCRAAALVLALPHSCASAPHLIAFACPVPGQQFELKEAPVTSLCGWTVGRFAVAGFGVSVRRLDGYRVGFLLNSGFVVDRQKGLPVALAVGFSVDRRSAFLASDPKER